jgi:hypothetical protein
LFAFALGGLVILCLLGLAWGFIEMGRLRRELLRSQTEHADQLARERELEAQEAAGREQLEQVTQDLARVRDQLAALEARKPEEPGAAHLFSFILTGGLARVGGPTPTLRLPPGMEAVALKVARDDKDYRNYSAALRTAEGAEVWTWTSVRAIPRRSGTEIVLKVPAARLARNDYTLRLTGISSTGVAEDAGQYYFRVER